jgi:Photoprotection regulator fluorescence recovery protein
MDYFTWSGADKKAARTMYDAAVQAELAEIMVEFKRRALAAAEPSEMWDLEDWLRDTRLAFDRKYDYRYSVLVGVLGELLSEGRITPTQLQTLSNDKVEAIENTADYISARAKGA